MTASPRSARAAPTSPTPRGRSTTRRSPLCEDERRRVRRAGGRHRRPDGRHEPGQRGDHLPRRARRCTPWSGRSPRAPPTGATTPSWPPRSRRPTPTPSPTPRSTSPGPGEESGTYDTFVEFAIADLAEERGQDEATRADYASSPNDNLIVDGIESSESSLGWVGFAFYAAEQERMKAIEIDGGDGCVAPTPETIADGTYPLLAEPVHLRQHGQRREQPGRRLVRRPVPLRRRPGDRRRGRLRRPARRPRPGHARRLGGPLSVHER